MTPGPLHTPLCDLLGIQHPILMAGMGGVATADLAAAVSEAGGLGIIGAAAMDGDEIRRQVRRLRDLTDRPFGVDILLPTGVETPRPPADGKGAPRTPSLSGPYGRWLDEVYAEFGLGKPDTGTRSSRGAFSSEFTSGQVEAVIDEQVPVFAAGLGDPAPYISDVRAYGGRVIALVGNVRNARRVAAGGVDVVVAQGTEAGGHTGRIGAMALVPQVVDAVAPTMVAAAGGIGDGRGLVAALALGAVGAWVGTAFLVSREASWPESLKQRVLDAGEEDTRVTRLYSGKTMRNITNPLIERWESSGLAALPMGPQLAIANRLQKAAIAADRIDLTMNPAGQVSGMLHEIRPAADIMADLVQDATVVLERLRAQPS
ncbi:MAG: nitronate monooxygenase [Dehalococcoidia bacterium]|nr:nitronate monooxygenase [Dehalococcoidia bacterium]